MNDDKPVRWRTPMEDAPHAHHMGRMLANFSTLERELYRLFANIVRVSPSHAEIIWREIMSISPKLDIMIRILNTWPPQSDSETLRNLIERARVLNTERNKYVHATWLAGSTNDHIFRQPNILPKIGQKKSHDGEEISLQRISDFADSIGVLAFELFSYMRMRRA